MGSKDVSERQPAEVELRRQEKRLRLIIDGVRDHAISMLDAEGRIETFNAPAERIKGFTLAEVQGQHFRMFFTAEDRAAGLPEHELAVARAQGKFEGEGWRQRKDGSLFYAAVSLSALRDEDGELVGFVKVTQDITERRRTAQRIDEEARVSEALYRAGLALGADLDLGAIVQRLTDEATALCRASFGSFFYNVKNEAGESYMLYTLSGVPREAFAGFPMPRNTAVFGPTFNGEGVLRSDDITKDPRYGKSPPYYGMPPGHLPVRSYLAVPVVSRSGEVHGGLFFGHPEAGIFTERDERLLVALAAQAAVALDNARLHAATAGTERKYRALAESSPQLVWTTYPDGALEYCNRRFLDFVGLTLERLQRLPDWDLIVHPEDAPRSAAAWSEAVRTGSPYQVEYRLKRAEGGVYRWFLVQGVPVRDDAGQLTRWVGSCTDIDDRRRSEETQRFLAEAGAALAASLDCREALQAVARLAVPAMADWCAVDLVTDGGAVERVAIAHAHPERLAAAKELRDRYPPAEEGLAAQVLRGASPEVREVTDALLSGAARDAAHLRLLRELGLRSVLAVPIFVHRQVLGVLHFASAESGRRFEPRDVAVAEEIGRRAGIAIDNARLFELAQRERVRAEEASRAKDIFLSTLSHELRTPLGAVVGWAGMLRAGTLSPEKRERALEIIDRNAQAQVALIDDILDVSRIVSGKMRLSIAEVEIAQTVEAALDTVRPAADAKGVRLQAVLDPDAGMLHGDAARLQQVVWNLLNNAIKFTPRGGRVYVRLQRTDSQIEIVVADTGQGIEPALLTRVFERFMQADGTTTRRQGGLGLGLAIVKHLVELHGGTIRAESDGPGAGATFTVRLPVAPLRAAPPSVFPAARPALELRCPPELAGLDILVVDDEDDTRELIASVLESCHVKVRTAASVAEALGLFERRPPDVLVSDVGMPGQDGYELIRKVRALPAERGGRVPAIAVTAYAHPSDRTRALMEGYNNHVRKPTEPQELLVVIAAAVGRFPKR